MRARAAAAVCALGLLAGIGAPIALAQGQKADAGAHADAGAKAAATDAGANAASDSAVSDASAGGASDAAVSDAAQAGDAAEEGDAAAGDGGAAGDAGDGGVVVAGTCVEHVPEGSSRPTFVQFFPNRGVAGYSVMLEVVINHGTGERVLPEGFRIAQESEAAKGLQKAGFVVPDPEGGVAPSKITKPGEGGKSITTVTIPIVPLPKTAGRNTLILPPLPIAIARASNDYITICTTPHAIEIDEPIANELDPKVKPNPPPRPQREDWVLARQLTTGLAIGALLGVIGAAFYRWYTRRPKVEPPKPKPIPWLVALAELERIRDSDLLAENKTDEYFDRVSDTVRAYLGARYGFDTIELGWSGLETTTREMLDLLKRVRPPITELKTIRAFLDDCDLVKFARVTPTPEECLRALERGQTIVRRTIPIMPEGQLGDAGAARPPSAGASP